MKKFNYRTTVNINQNVMQLGFRCRMPDEMKGKKIRLQAVFSQRQVDRRFPVEVRIEERETGPQIMADADILLPYVFRQAPRHRVNVTFALWCGTEEWVLDEQPFPVAKELFARTEQSGNRNLLKFIGYTMALPFLLMKDYIAEGKDKEKAKKKTNESVYRASGYAYSPRQRNTDYFAIKYAQYSSGRKEMSGNKVLFLSERLPEEGGNLQRIKAVLEQCPDVEVTEFINTRTVDALKKKELKECARKCAEARVIVLEDFYPQLHQLKLRRETKVVQLWHACGAFKTFGLTRIGKPGGAPQSSMNHRNYDFVSVSSEKIRGIYAEAFGIPTNKVKALGVPRTDILFDWEYKKRAREALYAKYPEMRDSKIILFAPTFRGDGNKDAFYPAEAFDVNRFMDAMPEDVFCIVKHHPFVHQPVEIEACWSDRVMDLTGKDHINDLLLITDLLITDYSSSIFEAALLDVPMLFYAFDQEEYMASRDFYFDYDDVVPGPVEHNFRGMMKKAAQMVSGRWNPEKEERLPEKMQQFREAFLGALDGKSTERVAEYIKCEMLSAPDRDMGGED
ncbi:MAG: CDP-glycerol glycerophosphotransferase family protein [Eubacteriales bacterium]|nr:CDP-glycerol glycerophosphotransferase family protein [Eubacteriales bacterium]